MSRELWKLAILACLVGLVSCQTKQAAPTSEDTRKQVILSNETMADPVLTRDVTPIVLLLGGSTKASCTRRAIVKKQVVARDNEFRIRSGRHVAGTWSEVWTVDSCGEAHDVRIDFTPDGRGGTYFSTSRV